jgi:hypothetical protein
LPVSSVKATVATPFDGDGAFGDVVFLYTGEVDEHFLGRFDRSGEDVAGAGEPFMRLVADLGLHLLACLVVEVDDDLAVEDFELGIVDDLEGRPFVSDLLVPRDLHHPRLALRLAGVLRGALARRAFGAG